MLTSISPRDFLFLFMGGLGGILLGFILAKFSNNEQSGSLLKLLKYLLPAGLVILIVWILFDFTLVERGFEIRYNGTDIIKQRFSTITTFFVLIYQNIIELVAYILQG